MSDHDAERQRLVYELRVYLKALLTTSESVNDDDVVFESSVHLDRFCLAMEAVLRHGFKVKNSFFSGPSDYWDYVKNLGKLLPHAQQSISNANNFERAKTSAGKGRAFIRCALVEKALESFINTLVRNEKLTAEHYENWSILRTESDCRMVLALLAPLSVVEFSLCLKDIDFDHMRTDLGTADDALSDVSTHKEIQQQKQLMHQKDIEIDALQERVKELSEQKDPRELVQAVHDGTLSIEDLAARCVRHTEELKQATEKLVTNETESVLLVGKLNIATKELQVMKEKQNLRNRTPEEIEVLARKAVEMKEATRLLGRDITRLRGELAEKQAEIDRLQEEARSSTAGSTELQHKHQDTMDRLASSLTEVQSELKEEKSAHAQLREEHEAALKDARVRMERLEEEVNRAQHSTDGSSAEIAELRTKLERSEQQCAQLLAANADLQKREESTEQEHQRAIADLRVQLEAEGEKRAAKWESELAAVREALEAHKEAAKQSRDELSQTKAALNAAETAKLEKSVEHERAVLNVTSQVERLAAEKASKEEELRKVEALLEKKSQQYKVQKTQLEELKERHENEVRSLRESSEERVQQLRDDVAQLKSSLASSESQSTRLEEALRGKESVVAELEGKIEVIKAEQQAAADNDQSQVVALLKEQLEAAQAEVKMREAEFRAAENSLREKLAEANEQAGTAAREIDSLSSQVSARDAELNDWKHRCSEAESERDREREAHAAEKQQGQQEHQAAIDQLGSDKQALEDDLSRAKQEKDEVYSHVSIVQAEAASHAAEKRVLAEQVAELGKSLAAKDHAMDVLEDRLSSLEAEHTAQAQEMKERADSVSKERDNLRTELVGMRAALESTSELAEQQKAEIDKLEAAIQITKGELADATRELSVAEAALAEEREKLTVAERSLQTASEEAQEIRTEKEALEEKLSAERDLSSQAAIYESDKLALQKSVERLEKRVVKLEGVEEALNAKNRQLLDQLSAAQRDAKAAAKEAKHKSDTAEKAEQALVKMTKIVEQRTLELEEVKADRDKYRDSVAELERANDELDVKVKSLQEDVAATELGAEEHAKQAEQLKSAHEELDACSERLEAMEKSLEKANQSLVSAHADRDAARAELKAAKEELVATQGKLEDLNAVVEAKANQLQQMAGIVQLNQGVQEELEAAKSKISALEEEKGELEDLAMSRQRRIEQLKEIQEVKDDELKTALADKEAALEALGASNEAQQRFASLQQELDVTRTEAKMERERADGLQAEVESLKGEIESWQAVADKSKQALEENDAERERFVTRAEELEKENATLTEVQQERDTALEQLREKEDVEIRLEDARKTIGIKEEEIAKLAQELETFQQRSTRFEQGLEQSREEVEELRSRLESLEGASIELERIKGEHERLQGEWSELQEKHESLSRSHQMQEDELKTAEAAHERVKELEKLLENGFEKFNERGHELKRLQMELEAVKKEKEKHRKAEVVKERLRKLNAVYPTLKKELKDATDRVSEGKNTIDTLNLQIASLKKQMDVAGASSETMELFKATLAVQVKELKAAREKLKEGVNDLQQGKHKVRLCEEELVKKQQELEELLGDGGGAPQREAVHGDDAIYT